MIRRWWMDWLRRLRTGEKNKTEDSRSDRNKQPLMSQETKQCKSCHQDFTIEPADFDFYRKIGVPPPTWCPECRLKRRLIWLNTFVLYKRPCDLCKKLVMSVYAPDAPYVVYCPSCWWSDAWDQHEHALDYNPTKTFFEQFGDLLHKTPVIGLSLDILTSKESPYTSNSGNLRNCYLLYHSNDDEDSAYSFYVEHCKALFDCAMCIQSERLYDSMHSWKCNNCVGSRSYVIESLDSAFLKDCSNCTNCFMCASLKNKKYCFKNQQLSKEEYLNERKKYDLGSYGGYQKAAKEAEEFWNTQIPKAEFGDRAVACSGTQIYESKNVRDSFQVNQGEDCRFIQMISDGTNSDLYDVTSWGDGLSDSYDSMLCGTQSSGIKFSEECGIGCIDLEYCKIVVGSSHCFGCVGMKKAQYCILNKQYPKEEYEQLVLKIKEDMKKNPFRDRRGRAYGYGEFFPSDFSPHAYNEAFIQNFFPLSQEEAEREGYPWRKILQSEHKTTITASGIPDHVKDVSDEILKEIIGCDSCGRGFMIIEMELAYLRRENLPVPRRCPFCRTSEKVGLWIKNMEQHERTCFRCEAKFLSKYTTEEFERLLCKRCYAAEAA